MKNNIKSSSLNLSVLIKGSQIVFKIQNTIVLEYHCEK